MERELNAETKRESCEYPGPPAAADSIEQALSGKHGTFHSSRAWRTFELGENLWAAGNLVKLETTMCQNPGQKVFELRRATGNGAVRHLPNLMRKEKDYPNTKRTPR